MKSYCIIERIRLTLWVLSKCYTLVKKTSNPHEYLWFVVMICLYIIIDYEYKRRNIFQINLNVTNILYERKNVTFSLFRKYYYLLYDNMFDTKTFIIIINIIIFFITLVCSSRVYTFNVEN